MTDMVKTNETRAMTIADFEARIHLYKEQIGTGYIGIGRTLLEAREAGAVPHGQWENWVTEVTGLTMRQAQRCMQAAREIRDGSQLARLEMSKALLLLSSGLDEDTREEVARRAADEGATVQALRREIREKQGQADDMARLAREYLEDADKHCRRANDAESALKEAAKENQDLRGQLERVDEYVRDQREQAAAEAVKLAQEQLQAQADGALAERDRQIRELKEDLTAAEAREERRARELEALRQERTQRAFGDARSVQASPFGVFDLARAVRSFIGEAGVLPQMGAELAALPRGERETVRQNIEAVAAWVDGARAALGIYAAEGAMVR